MPLHPDALLLVLALVAAEGYREEAQRVCLLSRALRDDVQLWAAIKDARHGPRGKTRLMHAAARGDAARLAWLLARGANPNAQCTVSYPWHAHTALQFACAGGHLPCVLALLAARASPALGRSDGCTPLHTAAAAGHAACVEALLEHARGGAGGEAAVAAALDAREEDGSAPLHRAAFSGQEGAAAALLGAGARAGAVRASDGSTPLLLACASARRGGHEGLVALLLAAGAEPNVARRFDGLSPVLAAAEAGRLGALAALLGAGAEVQQGACGGGGGHAAYAKAPLMAAAQRGHCEAVALLLDAGAEVGAAQCGSLKTALHWAAGAGHCEAVALLAARGAPLNARTREGWTPLHCAARLGHVPAVKLLVGLGADAGVLDADRDSARDVAASHGHWGVVKELA